MPFFLHMHSDTFIIYFHGGLRLYGIMTLQKDSITFESPENNRSFISVPVFTCKWKVVILTSTWKRNTGLKKGDGGETPKT